MLEKLKNSKHRGLRGAMVQAFINYYEKRGYFPLPARISTVDRDNLLAENQDLFIFQKPQSQKATFSWLANSLHRGTKKTTKQQPLI